jgi:hypothetical protein
MKGMLMAHMKMLHWPSLIGIGTTVGAMAALQPACGRSDAEITCFAHRYSVAPMQNSSTLPAIMGPSGSQTTIAFTPPSFIVNEATHQAILNETDGVVLGRLHDILADATREICRRALEDNDVDFDFAVDENNCDDYVAPNGIVLTGETIEASEFDDQPGFPIELNPTCFAACLLEECSTHGDSGDHDPPPDHPFAHSVRCQCEIEEGMPAAEHASARLRWNALSPGWNDYCRFLYSSRSR